MLVRMIYKRCATLLVSGLLASGAVAVPDDNVSVNVVESGWEGEVELTIPMSGGIPGDADGNGKVDAADMVIIVNYIKHLNPEGFVFKWADVTGDNVVDEADVRKIARMILGERWR